jgi:hypothetical protein
VDAGEAAAAVRALRRDGYCVLAKAVPASGGGGGGSGGAAGAGACPAPAAIEDRLSTAIDALEDKHWPPAFIFMYDEVWE